MSEKQVLTEGSGVDVTGEPFNSIYANEFDLMARMSPRELTMLATEALEAGNRDLTFMIAGMLLARAACYAGSNGIEWRQPSPYDEINTYQGALYRVAIIINGDNSQVA